MGLGGPVPIGGCIPLPCPGPFWGWDPFHLDLGFFPGWGGCFFLPGLGKGPDGGADPIHSLWLGQARDPGPPTSPSTRAKRPADGPTQPVQVGTERRIRPGRDPSGFFPGIHRATIRHPGGNPHGNRQSRSGKDPPRGLGGLPGRDLVPVARMGLGLADRPLVKAIRLPGLDGPEGRGGIRPL